MSPQKHSLRLRNCDLTNAFLTPKNTPMALRNLRFTHIKRRLIAAMAVIPMGADLMAAGLIALPRTGQTNTYYAGDDGSVRAGVAWPVPRFTQHGDGTATDRLTGLMWVTDGNLVASRDPAFDADGTAGDGLVTWEHALDYLAKLNAENYLGHADWRLPNIVELVSLIDFSRTNLALPAGHPFTNISAQAFWSSTTHGIAGGWTYIAGFSGEIHTTTWAGQSGWFYGFVGHSIAKDGSAGTFGCLPVRGGSGGVIQLPRTGQTQSYLPGDDGDLQQGVAWPCPRFADHGDGTVTDRLTGLMWTKDKVADLTWTNALDYIAGMNSGAKPSFGHQDWRLPNALEGASLLDHGCDGLSDGHPFTNTFCLAGTTGDGLPGWSGTVFGGDTRYDFDLFLRGFLQLGEIRNYLGTPGGNPVRPVRNDPRPLPSGSLTGSVATAGVGLENVRLTLTGPLSGVTRTDRNGRFAFTHLPAGAYTVTPESVSHAFAPAQASANLVQGENRTITFDGSLTNNLGWRKVAMNTPAPAFRAIHAISNEVWLVANGSIYYSPDFPRSPMQAVFTDPNTALTALTFVVTNGVRYGWAVGYASLGARSTNAAGTAWTRMSLGGSSTYTCVSFPDPQTGFASGMDHRLHKTTDGGAHWLDTGLQLGFSTVFDLVFFNRTNGLVCTADPRLAETRDGGKTMMDFDVPTGIVDIFALDQDHAWAVGVQFIFYWGPDPGDPSINTFVEAKTPLNLNCDRIWFANSTEGWAGGVEGCLIRSRDGGRTWTSQPRFTQGSILDLFFTNPTNGWAITRNEIFHYGPLFETAPSESKRLSINRTGTNVVLSWPAAATGFTLTATPQLGTNATWTSVTNPPSLLGTNQVVTNAAVGTSRFYRLQTQP